MLTSEAVAGGLPLVTLSVHTLGPVPHLVTRTVRELGTPGVKIGDMKYEVLTIFYNKTKYLSSDGIRKN